MLHTICNDVEAITFQVMRERRERGSLYQHSDVKVIDMQFQRGEWLLNIKSDEVFLYEKLHKQAEG